MVLISFFLKYLFMGVLGGLVNNKCMWHIAFLISLSSPTEALTGFDLMEINIKGEGEA
ncbi:hypothetical protein J2S82_002214 [Aeromonas caviae]|nr:hypothetical protein [Aeromonas caviae]